MRYWTEKVDLFGPGKAFKPLCIQDLQDEDQAALTGGGFKILPETDQAGRGIIVSCRAKWDNRRTHRKSMLRVVWYIMHCALEVEYIQKRGVIVLSTANLQGCSFTFFDLKLDRMFVRHLQKVIPVKWVALHQFSKKSSMVQFLLPNFLHLLGPHMRCRYRLHYIAEEKEHTPELERYGIRGSVLPTDIMGGTYVFDYREWLMCRKFLEAARAKIHNAKTQRCCINATFDSDKNSGSSTTHNCPLGVSEIRDVVNAKRRFLGLADHDADAHSSSSSSSSSAEGPAAAMAPHPDTSMMSETARSLLNHTKRAHSECLLASSRHIKLLGGYQNINEAMQPPPKKFRSADRVGSYNRIKDLFQSTIVRSNWSSQHENDELCNLFTGTRPTSTSGSSSSAIRSSSALSKKNTATKDQLEISLESLSPRSMSPTTFSPGSLSP